MAVFSSYSSENPRHPTAPSDRYLGGSKELEVDEATIEEAILQLNAFHGISSSSAMSFIFQQDHSGYLSRDLETNGKLQEFRNY